MVFPRALDLHNEFFHQGELALVLFTEMLFTHLGGLLLAIFGSEGHAEYLLGSRPRLERAVFRDFLFPSRFRKPFPGNTFRFSLPLRTEVQARKQISVWLWRRVF